MTAQSTWWVFALLSAAFAALTTIFAKVGVTQVNSNLATAIRTVVILVIAWGIVFMRGEHLQIASIGRRALVFLVLSGAATGLSWLCYFRALQLGKASAVAPVDKSSVVFILILSALFLGEAFTWKSVLGTLFIAVGTILFIL